MRTHLVAQRLLEATDDPVDLVASHSGFGTATNLRHHFHRVVRTGPTANRRAFRSSAAADDQARTGVG